MVTRNILQRFADWLRLSLDSPLQRLLWSVISLVVIIAVASIGYILIESMTPLEALYMTVITIGTVGYGEVIPLSDSGRLFTIIVIILGVAATTIIITNALGIVLGSLLWNAVQQRRLRGVVQNMENHYIICGYGRIGRQTVLDLISRHQPFVVVDENPDMEEIFIENNIPYVVGDATKDEVLLKAGIQRANGFVSALNSDADNVLTVLSARELRPDLFITARAVRGESESKLRRAGASQVINPYQIGGNRIALSVLRPAVHNFLSHLLQFGEDQEIEIGQIKVHPESAMVGKTVATCGLREKFDVNIIAIQLRDGDISIIPNSAQLLEAGMILIIIGPPQRIHELERDYHTKPVES